MKKKHFYTPCVGLSVYMRSSQDILIYFHQNRFHLIAEKMFLGAKYRAENIGNSKKKWHKKVRRPVTFEPMSHLYI